jgi:WD40 repeat protein
MKRLTATRERIVTSYEQTAKVWDATSGKLLTTLEGHTAKVLAASFSPDGSRINTTGADGIVKVWDVHLEGRKPDEIAINEIFVQIVLIFVFFHRSIFQRFIILGDSNHILYGLAYLFCFRFPLPLKYSTDLVQHLINAVFVRSLNKC